MFDILKFFEDIKNINSCDKLDKYLEGCFVDLEEYFEGLSFEELDKLKFNFENFLYDFEDKFLGKNNSQIQNALLILLSEKFEQAKMVGVLTILLNYLPESGAKKRAEATILYLRVNDVTKDYFDRFDKILSLLQDSFEENFEYEKSIKSVINFYFNAMEHFSRINNANLEKSFKKLFTDNLERYTLLKDKTIQKIVDLVTIDNYQQELIGLQKVSKLCVVKNNNDIITIENSNYSKKLYELINPKFEDFRSIAFSYIKSIGDPEELYGSLNRGVAIIDKSDMLFKYMASFGTKHKEKLYSAFEVIIDKIETKKLNIVDWGCGQAFATMILLDFANKKRIKLNIEDICLIEPSKLALSRGLLHIDVLKQKEYNIKTVNCDLDCLKSEDIAFDNDNTTLHLFSNILDIENFQLNREFLKKISTNIKSNNLFVCVSPNINDKRNSRLDLFFKYFDENFNTELYSHREDNVSGHKRYEIIFEVKFSKETKQEEIEYHTDVYSKLVQYSDIIEPTLVVSKLKENIESDADYVIFKIRKVAEIITSKIFISYGGKDDSRVSQNDKIRYLSYEKKIFGRKIQSLLHTIRTIGNIATHEHIDNPIKMLKDDAYFLLTALMLLIDELKKQKLL